jgi:hypothetical protein
MNCKNCNTALQADDHFCHSCGAKIMRNRLTFKNLWEDLNERVLNLDNNLFRTIRDMFLRPQLVIEGYIEGVRKKYMDPISYLGVALTLSGIILFILRKYYLDDMDFDMGIENFDPELARKIMLVSLDFNSFVFLLYIPVITLVGWVVYNQKALLLSEYLVLGTYTLAHFSILSFPISLCLLIFNPENYFDLSFWVIALMALYCMYTTIRVHGFRFLNSLLFILGFLLGFMAIGILLNLIFLATGVITIQDYLPK